VIIPLKQKHKARFSYPRHSGHSENGVRTHAHRPKKHNPDKFICPCGGLIKMVNVFENGKLHNVARCDKCGREEHKPSDFQA